MCIVTKIAVVLNEFVALIPAVSPHIFRDGGQDGQEKPEQVSSPLL